MNIINCNNSLNAVKWAGLQLEGGHPWVVTKLLFIERC